MAQQACPASATSYCMAQQACPTHATSCFTAQQACLTYATILQRVVFKCYIYLTWSCFWSLEPVVKIIGVLHLLPLLDIQAPNHSLVKTPTKQFENFVRQVRQFLQIKERFIVTYKSCCLWNEDAEFQFPSWRLYLLNLCNMFVAFSL